ncbi:hypothetical protein D3C87_1963540 [compost metagenome]
MQTSLASGRAAIRMSFHHEGEAGSASPGAKHVQINHMCGVVCRSCRLFAEYGGQAGSIRGNQGCGQRGELEVGHGETAISLSERGMQRA